MTMVLNVREVKKEWNGASLFADVSFEVGRGERLALFGRNGSGKTTLLQGLLGKIAFDSGRVHRILPLEEWGWMEQQADPGSRLTLLEYVQSRSGEIYRVKKELERLQSEMGSGQASEAIVERYGLFYEQYMQLGGYDWEVKVEKRLGQMNLPAELWNLPFGQLSGGQKTRAQLTALMVREPKFILLDEPTNHLDTASLNDLEEWVRGYEGTILYVSHDRTFMDRTATSILELQADGCRRYAGGYSDYRQQKEVERRTQMTLYKKQELERQALEQSIRRYQEWFHQAHRAARADNLDVAITASFYKAKAKKNISRYHAKQKELERLEQNRVEKPRETKTLRMNLQEGAFAASTLLRLSDVGFGYGYDHRDGNDPGNGNGNGYAHGNGNGNGYDPGNDNDNGNGHDPGCGCDRCHSHALGQGHDNGDGNDHGNDHDPDSGSGSGQNLLFRHFNLQVERGDRIGVLGPNGTGKSTLLKLVTGQLAPSSGTITLHPQASIGYFAQELHNLDESKSILDSLLVLPDMTESHARTILGCFLFSRDEVYKKIEDLSMGEKCRVAFLKLFFGQSNLLILDEPTNYLDIDTREVVEEALCVYPGALMIVTHDRYLARKVCNRLLMLDGRKEPEWFPGTVEEYEARDRTNRLDPAGQWAENERERLELELAFLMGREEPPTLEEREKLMTMIAELRRKIKALSEA
ncbi:ABC-F family ATP-binding cassette domain-containing protein [Paenibacillus fonticola]|uniref:ABC-F family ATP-binding cassette domain-containing protein n=1 Tax=Paenibacillus fonticola TaxID=379896 RepID=UPI000364FF1F|nr:ABC-F family ATP-binding cassette domain-containing protein [Paenibacillus fonticola]